MRMMARHTRPCRLHRLLPHKGGDREAVESALLIKGRHGRARDIKELERSPPLWGRCCEVTEGGMSPQEGDLP
jgi:hypothetical protein